VESRIRRGRCRCRRFASVRVEGRHEGLFRQGQHVRERGVLLECRSSNRGAALLHHPVLKVGGGDFVGRVEERSSGFRNFTSAFSSVIARWDCRVVRTRYKCAGEEFVTHDESPSHVIDDEQGRRWKRNRRVGLVCAAFGLEFVSAHARRRGRVYLSHEVRTT